MASDADFDLEDHDEDCVPASKAQELENEILILSDRIEGWESDYEDLENLIRDERSEWADHESKLTDALEEMKDLLLRIKDQINDSL